MDAVLARRANQCMFENSFTLFPMHSKLNLEKQLLYYFPFTNIEKSVNGILITIQTHTTDLPS